MQTFEFLLTKTLDIPMRVSVLAFYEELITSSKYEFLTTCFCDLLFVFFNFNGVVDDEGPICKLRGTEDS